MVTFLQASELPATQKLVFSIMTTRKHFFAWAVNGAAYEEASADEIVNVFENDVEMTEESSLAAVQVAVTTVVGAWFWDIDTLRLYVKPKATTGVFENFYRASVRIVASSDGSTLDSLPTDERITKEPTLALKTPFIFDGKLGQTGAGGISYHNVDAFFVREDIELDGLLEIVASFEVP